jgi:hypothetical protein
LGSDSIDFVNNLDYRCRLESPTSVGRSGVSQIYQLHVIEGEEHRIFCELFPHLNDKLINEYIMFGIIH